MIGKESNTKAGVRLENNMEGETDTFNNEVVTGTLKDIDSNF